MEFEWDISKELHNIGKHGVSFADAVESFSDPNGLRLRDAKHSLLEVRSYWVGKCNSGRVLTTWFTQRGDRIRIIGAAEWRKLRRLYDERATAQ